MLDQSGLVTIIGTPISPYVRKVLAVCEVKGVGYRLDPIVPFFGDDRFSKLSPLRRIPVLIDGGLVLSDSSVICQYLEDRYPAPAVFPADVADRAQARWIEEFADTRMGDVFIWRIFNKMVIGPAIWGAARDTEAVARTRAEDVPGVMAYLEEMAPADGFLFGDLGIADIAIAVFFRNLSWARVDPFEPSWSKTSAWVGRVASSHALDRISKVADQLVRVPPPQQRLILADAGFTLTETSLADPTPRRGPMTV